MPKPKRTQGPLRVIVAMIHPSTNIYQAERVLLSCGHKAKSWGGVRA